MPAAERGLTRDQRRQAAKESAVFPATLIDVPESEWPPHAWLTVKPKRVLRSRDYLMQVFVDEHPLVLARLSVNRTQSVGGDWQDGIGWEHLQDLKGQAGFAFYDAVEVYPNGLHVVNVANMRHLWVLREAIPFKWS